jgi:cytochrome P450
MSFGIGPRGCFGRRLGYLAVKLAVTMLVWHFEFLEVPGELASMEKKNLMTSVPAACYVKLRRVEV